jgi:hypothetical protein
MQRIISVIGQAFRQSILLLALISLFSLSSLFMFSPSSSLAAAFTDKSPALEKRMDAGMNSQAVENRAEAYEKAVEAVDEPQGIEKVYEENLESYEDKNPALGPLKEVKELIKDVTKTK